MLIIRSRKPSEIQAFVLRNDATVSRGTAGDSLKAYQAKNGGTGATFYDLEKSWLKTLGYTSIDDYLLAIGYGIGVLRQRIQTYLAGYTSVAPSTDALLLEDGSFFLIEDGSKLLLG